jgi:flagellar export protein FliJ
VRGRIDGLIRLARWQLDEKRRALAELENMQADFMTRCRQLDEELEREKTTAAGDPAGSYRFSDFVRATLMRRTALLDSLRRIEAEIEAMRDEVHAAFQELKKLELFEARQQTARRQERDRREQAVLDDIGLARHRRGEG